VVNNIVKELYIMKNFFFLTLLLSSFLIHSSHSKENLFVEAKKLFNDEKYEESKFLFQRNIVFNPKNADSYLYLAKIFKLEKDTKEEEKNLKTTLLLDPKNEEAIFLLINVELERSNFAKVKKMKEDFQLICSSLCKKIPSINERLKNFDTKNES
tara:strand:- start:2145 stop:2609 length:465 start_codon:yes stop_codon:yes gene_type:complete